MSYRILMFVVALFISSKIWKQFKYLLTDKENVCVYMWGGCKILNIIQMQKEGNFVILTTQTNLKDVL